MTRDKTRALLILVPLLAIAATSGAGAPPGAKIRAGVFDGNGASPACVVETYEALRIDPDIEPSFVHARDIPLGALDRIDVLVFPGGSGSKQYQSLGLGQRETVRDFVLERGKGIVGICAGGYLVSDSEGYPCLNLIGANTVDREHDERGSALVEISFTDTGLEIFPEMKGLRAAFVQYHDGPLFVPAPEGEHPAYDVLAIVRSDVHLTGGSSPGVTPGKPMFIRQEAGRGRIFASAGHPEGTAGMRWIVPRMVRWAARRELVPYMPEVVRPARDTAEVMHHDALEAALFWALLDEDADTRMDALRRLVEMRYRSGTRWAIGCLRDQSSAVRALAASILSEDEYTAAIPDLEAAAAVEQDVSCRQSLDASIRWLRLIRRER